MTHAGARRVLPRAEREAMGTAVANAARDDPALYRMLLARLIETNEADMANLQRTVATGDWTGVQRAVHRTKGSAALARCPTLVAAGKSLESAARQGKRAVIDALLPRYVAIVTEFNDALIALQAAAPGAPAHAGSPDPGDGASPSSHIQGT
ncbi:Hpt domain-containing protein [Cupriavidus campinensis]|uniref:Hpt domain-containing protein n=1 Tax=Cupriavidus campinensis TaxID=151783 RepID=A0AAE9L5F0_9BURK|nr:Hpt domain-containing protein [Cupriavidus campinensis]TSP09388.1 Hpt domain-containing protein [Cupriavidus campinensis]URF07185.1 Hpt domain-containing protein [Cupriavidus campinensis]